VKRSKWYRADLRSRGDDCPLNSDDHTPSGHAGRLGPNDRCWLRQVAPVRRRRSAGDETGDVPSPDRDHLMRRRSNERRQLGDAHRSWLRDHSEVHPTSRVWALLGWRVDPVTVVPGLRIGSLASRRQARRLVADGVNCVVDLRPNTLDPVKWPDRILFTRLAMPGDRSPSADELLEAVR
jgi:hypothetical protein